MTKKDLVDFRKLLLERKALLLGDVKQMSKEALEKNGSAGRESSTLPLHPADLGSDNYEQEFTLGLIEGQQDELRMINRAIDRIQEGTYGVCGECGKKIPKVRLKAVPHAQLCIDCKRQEEISA